MARDQYSPVRHGEQLAGLPRMPWNDFLRDRGPKAPPAPGGVQPTTAVEIDVQNLTGTNLLPFAVVKVADPVIKLAGDPDAFKRRDLMEGTAPTASARFAITQVPLERNEIGRARLQGLARCQVNVTDAAHTFASPTTVTTHLTSGASGPARILWRDPAAPATGTKWCVVELLGQSVTTKARFVRFTLPGALAVTDASKASCTVDDYWGGSDPGATVTVYNLPASTNYVFSGASGNKGLATYDDVDDKYWVVQLQCP